MRSGLVALLAAVAAGPVQAKPVIATGDRGFDTFVSGCAASVGSLEGVKAYLASEGFRPAPPAFAAGQFQSPPDHVWLAPLPDQVAVVTQPDGMLCRVYVRGGNIARQVADFRRLVEGMAAPGFFARKTQDGALSTARGPAQYLQYHVGADAPQPGATGRLFSIATSDQPGAPFSTIMTVGAVAAEGSRAK